MIFDRMSFPTGNNNRERFELSPLLLDENDQPALRVRITYVVWSKKYQAYSRRYSETFITEEQVRELLWFFENHVTTCTNPIQCGHGGVDQITIGDGLIKVQDEFIQAMRVTIVVPPKVEGRTPFTAITCLSYESQNAIAHWINDWLKSIRKPAPGEEVQTRTLVKNHP